MAFTPRGQDRFFQGTIFRVFTGKIASFSASSSHDHAMIFELKISHHAVSFRA